MANNPHVSLASRNLGLDAALDVLDGGGFLRVYDGTQPANADVGLAGNTLLAELALSTDAFVAAVSGAKVANAITSSIILATSTATWATLVKSDGVTRVFDMSAGASGADLNFGSADFQIGATCSVSALTISQAA